MAADSRGDERMDRPAERQPGPDDEPQELMEQVLEETLAAADQAEAISGELVRQLRQLARRQSDEARELQPPVTELVRVILTPRFPTLAGPHEPWLSMTARIAETLWEDPASRQRLQSLWRRLQPGEVN